MKKIILSVIVVIFSITIYAQKNEEFNRHLTYAETAFKMGNYKDAIEEYEEVVKLNPNYADAWYNLAIICSEKLHTIDYLKKAIEYYKKYAALVPAEKAVTEEKIFALEYRVKKGAQSEKHLESVLGFWKTTSYNPKTGQPDAIIEVTSFQGKLRIKLLQNSNIYSGTLTNIVANADLYQESLVFGYTDDKNYVPNPAKWDALKVLGNLGGGFVGGGLGSIISAGTEVAGNMGAAGESGTSTRKFYDFYISEFGNDTLKGFVHQYASVKEAKTNNSRVLSDDVIPVQFIRGGDNYNISSKQPKAEKAMHYDSLKIITTLGFSSVFSFLENPRRFEKIPANFGGAMNLDFTFIPKKNSTKKAKSGFSMGFELLMEGGMSEKWKIVFETVEEYKSRSVFEYMFDFSWNLKLTVGWAGLSKISDKTYFSWGIKPLGLHFSGYGYTYEQEDKYEWSEYNHDYYWKKNWSNNPDMWGIGLCGSLDLGLGFQTSKKCIITPYFRCSYAVDFKARDSFSPSYYFNHSYSDLLERGAKYRYLSVFPLTVQVGLSFNFLGYHKTKPPREQKIKQSGGMYNLFRSISNY